MRLSGDALFEIPDSFQNIAYHGNNAGLAALAKNDSPGKVVRYSVFNHWANANRVMRVMRVIRMIEVNGCQGNNRFVVLNDVTWDGIAVAAQLDIDRPTLQRKWSRTVQREVTPKRIERTGKEG